ncbi:ubiquinone/menaquinone biosynthesis C-methylase UbiE [Ulvibacter sp. MAR_2010_11]|uniref:class I SAM-dependent methyltransferase n=1 Tax=Ulvibacter sp. MAR_2010_11 TaxID=1250229 RepID=UPI000C2C8BCF|nr:methyltransferase domain-containing protein [Ulvibacter sp. MAR_2010_11]PKA83748.1 ubiquinone/menaquinone biosynthesis C-methylase UbiE [Ulvibacter sp. MAR_2010_11]
MQEKNAYILGTDTEELHRLGVQHQVWAEEAQHGWSKAHFTAGQTLLDLGCGPGFCTEELAYITGSSGKVIGVDRSAAFIEHLRQVANLHHLSIQGIVADFDDMHLDSNSLDGMYCRWALAWLPNPKEILQKVYNALKPDGKMVIHEYYDWSTHQIEPHMPQLAKAIAAALKSFKDSPGEIDIGRRLPAMLEEMGMEVTSIRLMSKIATPSQFNWHWPKTFYRSYFPRLADNGYLTKEDVTNALFEHTKLEQTKGATLCCPLMVEVIAKK